MSSRRFERQNKTSLRGSGYPASIGRGKSEQERRSRLDSEHSTSTTRTHESQETMSRPESERFTLIEDDDQPEHEYSLRPVLQNVQGFSTAPRPRNEASPQRNQRVMNECPPAARRVEAQARRVEAQTREGPHIQSQHGEIIAEKAQKKTTLTRSLALRRKPDNSPDSAKSEREHHKVRLEEKKKAISRPMDTGTVFEIDKITRIDSKQYGQSELTPRRREIRPQAPEAQYISSRQPTPWASAGERKRQPYETRYLEPHFLQEPPPPTIRATPQTRQVSSSEDHKRVEGSQFIPQDQPTSSQRGKSTVLPRRSHPPRNVDIPNVWNSVQQSGRLVHLHHAGGGDESKTNAPLHLGQYGVQGGQRRSPSPPDPTGNDNEEGYHKTWTPSPPESAFPSPPESVGGRAAETLATSGHRPYEETVDLNRTSTYRRNERCKHCWRSGVHSSSGRCDYCEIPAIQYLGSRKK